ncbi:hypothetical protein [Streptomyces sp. MMG1121]|uniref:hypothetical protein n=1 Tax=Streptomyces sp. MMG1121 TaxID=1415544 RepID=UPI0006AFD669|nr:hypothetical protein [Streptomyces sp. MMG1121]KOV66388.1 hypothetical protein ADK64_12755 [Streptomyces sp. MMG1121]
MIMHISHRITGLDPADVNLALVVARDLHLPIPKPRAPEVVATPVPELMGLRTSAVRTHRRKVPLNRLSAVRA